MKLIGMLDSPYVRRVAISLQLLELPFEHESLSVFRAFDAFHRINPVVKAPSLICDDGEVLMDSTLILEYAERLARPRTLMPAELPAFQDELRLIGLALAACEKSVQIVYERGLRPPEKQHEPWLARVGGQLCAACDEIESALVRHPTASTREGITQGGVSAAVAWQFICKMTPDIVPAEGYPGLSAFAAQAEALPEFIAAPYGDSTYKATG